MALNPPIPFGVPGEAYLPPEYNVGPGPRGGYVPPSSGGLSSYAQQLLEMQSAANAGPVGNAPSPFVQQQLSAWDDFAMRPRFRPELPPAPRAIPMGPAQRQAPRMFGQGGGNMGNLNPRGVPSTQAEQMAAVQRALGQEVRATPAAQGAGGAGGATAQGAAQATAQASGRVAPSAAAGGGAAGAGGGVGGAVPRPSGPMPADPNPFPQMSGVGNGRFAQFSSRFPKLGAVARSAGGFGTGLGFTLAGQATGNPSLQAAGQVAPWAGMAGPAPALVAGSGIALGDAGGRITSGAPSFFSREILGQSDQERSATSQAYQVGMNELKDKIPGGIDDAVIDFLSPAGDPMRESVGLESLPIIGGFFGGGGGDEEGGDGSGVGGAAGQFTPIAPEEFAPYLSRAGLTPEGVQSALTEYTAMRDQNRVYAELGLLTIPSQNDKGEFLNADGDVVETVEEAALVRIPPEQADEYSAQQFRTAIPELIVTEQQALEAQTRAAAYRAYVDQTLGPQLDFQRELGNVYSGLTANMPGMNPAMSAAFANRGRLMDLSLEGEANALDLYANALPELQAIQSDLDLQRQMDAQIQNAEMQLLLQQMRPDLFAAAQSSDLSLDDALLNP